MSYSPTETLPARQRYSPAVRRLAAEHGIDPGELTGTGRDGRVTRRDLEGFVDRPEREPAVAAVAPAPVPVAGAKQSLTVAAHCHTWIEVDLSRAAGSGNDPLSLVAQATIGALREHPALNAWLEGDRFTRHAAVHLAIRSPGLQVIRDAHELSLEGLARHVAEPAAGAGAGAAAGADSAAAQSGGGGGGGGGGAGADSAAAQSGATFTITSSGADGALMATPVIELPQVAILDLGAVVKRPVIVTDGDGHDLISIRSIAVLALGWDHRALDGALAALFLGAIKGAIESGRDGSALH
jgi:pyruvate/2-oxoglutarate dehydrogenase complex dihydrolipoamide acyltransferase (E2) component